MNNFGDFHSSGDARVSAFSQRSEFGLYAGTATSLQMNVKRARSIRNLRRRVLGAEKFSGPAWDILLHLFESHVFQRRDTVGTVCSGTKIPTTTALRWLKRLEHSDTIHSHDHPFDARCRFVELSPTGVAIMTRYFSGVEPHAIAA